MLTESVLMESENDRTSFCCLFNLFLSFKVVSCDARQIPKLSFDESCYHPGLGFWLEECLPVGPILWLFICNSIINSALPQLKTDPWWQKVENVKICEILIKLGQTSHWPQICKKLMMMSQFYKYKLETGKKLSLYYTHDIFSSLDDSFCASTQNCPLWVTNSVRKKFVILVLSPLLPVDKSSGERDIQKIMCLLLQYARHMIYVKERIKMIPGIYIFCPSKDIMMVVELI